MSKTLRTLAAAAVLAVSLTQVANAALVTTTINFENVAAGTDLTSASNPYNTLAYGFTTFSGSAITLNTLDANTDPTRAVYSPCPPAPQSCAGVQASLTITVGNLFQGNNGSMGLLVDVANSGALNYTIRNATGAILGQGDFSPPSGTSFRDDPVALAFNGLAKSITFSGAASTFKIDNLSFWFDNSVAPPTNPVPEPASMALVALGLVGAVVTRGRKS